MCISTRPKKPSHPTTKAKGKMAAMLKPLTTHYARTVHITPASLSHVSGASLTRETTCGTTSKDDVHDRLESQHTWSPRETMYVIVSRIDVRDCLEKRRTWSPQETTYMAASRDGVRGCRKRQRAWLARETRSVIILITKKNVYKKYRIFFLNKKNKKYNHNVHRVYECEPVLWREVTYQKPEEPREG